MRFAHLSDVHIGAWRDPAMKGMNLEAFKRAVAIIIDRKLDFVVISGDFFNTAVPAIDHLQETVVLLKKLKKADIPVYIIPGSHDYSAGGKTILDVLEETELMIGVMKGKVVDNKLILNFTIDQKTGAKLAGLGGRRGSLEMKEYEKLDLTNLEEEKGFKIFMFHTSIDELKPEAMAQMTSISINEFPAGFDYYAGGHIHIIQKADLPGRKNVIYPGPTYPCNFHELWELGRGSFYIYHDSLLEQVSLPVKNVVKMDVNANTRSPEDVTNELDSKMKLKDFNNSIVMIRVHGKLRSGKPSDIDFKRIITEIYNKSAYFVMRSTTQLTSDELEEMGTSGGTADEIEDEAIRNYAEAKKHVIGHKDASAVKGLMHALSDEQKDGEKKYEYDSRIKKDADRLLL